MTTPPSDSISSQILTVWLGQESWERVGDIWDLIVPRLPLAPGKNILLSRVGKVSAY